MTMCVRVGIAVVVVAADCRDFVVAVDNVQRLQLGNDYGV